MSIALFLIAAALLVFFVEVLPFIARWRAARKSLDPERQTRDPEPRNPPFL